MVWLGAGLGAPQERIYLGDELVRIEAEEYSKCTLRTLMNLVTAGIMSQ